MTNLSILSNVFDNMASTADDKGKETFGVNLTVDEGFAIAKALSHEDTYRWHDLRKNPNDLPIYEKPYWCVIETMGKTLYDSKIKREYTVLKRYQILNLKEFVIAWREIEPFEVDE